ncbi:MAG: hypothetical protein ACREQX_06285 [Candidatus Binataceae bacterium]
MKRWMIAAAITLSLSLSATPLLMAQDNGGDGAAPAYRDNGAARQSSAPRENSEQPQPGVTVPKQNNSPAQAGDADNDNEETNSVNSGGDLSGPHQEPNFQNQPPADKQNN